MTSYNFEKEIKALYKAAGDYHAKQSKGPGGAAICICGAASGGSDACTALALIRDIFRYADFQSKDANWQAQFKLIQQCFK